MICLIEGVNRTGKDTLAQRLQADLEGFQHLHFSVPDLSDAWDYFMQELREVEDQSVIINRLHWSNYAYNGMLGGPVLSDFDWWRLDQWVSQRPCVVLLLVDDPHAIHARVLAEQRDPSRPGLKTPAEIGEVQTRFQRCFDRSAIGHKWSFGLDQLLTLSEHDGVKGWLCTPVYERLLNLLRGQETER